MSRDSDAHAGVIMMAFVMGAIAGAATALLVAPAAGSETRRALNERAREGRDKAGAQRLGGVVGIDLLDQAVELGPERRSGSGHQGAPR